MGGPTRERVVGAGDVHGLCVGHTGLDLMALLPLLLSVPQEQAEHGHDDEEQEDDSHDGPGRLALCAARRADLGVGVQLLHHQSCYREHR